MPRKPKAQPGRPTGTQGHSATTGLRYNRADTRRARAPSHPPQTQRSFPTIVTSADVIPGQNVQVLGLVRGNIVTSRHIGRDMMAGMKELVGGEIKSYTEMTDQARTVAEGRMIAEAERLGADAVVAMRFSSGSINPGTIEMLAYGTAVKFV